MLKEHRAYCAGCGYLNTSGEASCDYQYHVGHRRGCSAGEGCPHHTARAEKGENERAEAEARRLFADGATDEGIAAALGWTDYRVKLWRRQNGLKREPGWNLKKEKGAGEEMKQTPRTTEDKVIEQEAAAAPRGVKERKQELFREILGSAGKESEEAETATPSVSFAASSPAERGRQDGGGPSQALRASSPQEEPRAAGDAAGTRSGGIRMEPRESAGETPPGWATDDFAMAHRCIGVIEGIAEGAMTLPTSAKDKLLTAARTLCELMERARLNEALGAAAERK